MAIPLAFGGGNIIRVDVSSGSSWTCPDSSVLDLGTSLGPITMSLALVGYESSGSPAPEMQMLLETAMDVKFARSYSLGMFTALSSLDPTSNQRDLRDFKRVQRYLRWKITGKGTNITSFTFLLEGVLHPTR